MTTSKKLNDLNNDLFINVVNKSLSKKRSKNCIANIDFLNLNKNLKIKKIVNNEMYLFIDSTIMSIDKKNYIYRILRLKMNVKKSTLKNDKFFKSFVLDYVNDDKNAKIKFNSEFESAFIETIENKQRILNVTCSHTSFLRCNNPDFNVSIFKLFKYYSYYMIQTLDKTNLQKITSKKSAKKS